MTTRPFARTLTYLLLPFTLVFAGVPGCTEGGTETGNPSFDAKLSYTAYSSDKAVATVRDANTNGGVVVKSVWLGLGEVNFELDCDPDAPDNAHAPAIGVGNHASGAHVFTDFALRSGDYCSVDLPFVHGAGLTFPAEAPRELEDNSIVVEGEAPDGTPFSIVSDAISLVQLRGVAALGAPIPLDRASSQLLIAFDVATWLRRIDWTSAITTDGRIVISTKSNTALLAPFESDLKSGVILYRDENGDGVVDTSPKTLGAGETE